MQQVIRDAVAGVAAVEQEESNVRIKFLREVAAELPPLLLSAVPAIKEKPPGLEFSTSQVRGREMGGCMPCMKRMSYNYVWRK